METKSYIFAELFCMYEWDGCCNDGGYDDVLDSARERNIGLIFTKIETTVFIARRKLLCDWLDSHDVRWNDYDITPLYLERI